jgi:DNA-binding HxlR family transcriptional regulator
MIGERWGLLIVRDLLVEPKRFTDLQRGLPGIPSSVLTARLKELERADVVRRRLLPRPGGSVVYELTDYGHELEEVVMAFGRWGAKSLGDPRAGETITTDSMVMALRSTFRPERAKGMHARYELRLGEIVLSARVDDGSLVVGAGSLPNPDVVIEAGPGIRAVMAGEIEPEKAAEDGLVRIEGDPKLFARFGQLFRIDPKGAS